LAEFQIVGERYTPQMMALVQTRKLFEPASKTSEQIDAVCCETYGCDLQQRGQSERSLNFLPFRPIMVRVASKQRDSA